MSDLNWNEKPVISSTSQWSGLLKIIVVPIRCARIVELFKILTVILSE